MEIEKNVSVFAGRRLLSGPAPQAGPAKPPRAPRPGPAQRRAGLPPRACLLTRRAARPDRGRARPPRGRPALATHAARQPWPGTAPTRPPSPAGARALAQSRPHFLSFSSRAPSSALAAPELRRRQTPAPPRHSPIRRNRSYASPSLRSRSSLLRLPSTGRASPRLAADGHGAAVHGRHGIRLPSPLQPRLATLPSSPSPRTSPALARWRCRGRRRPPAAGRAPPSRQRALRQGALPRLARPSQAEG